jgi:hypothetical protein
LVLAAKVREQVLFEEAPTTADLCSRDDPVAGHLVHRHDVQLQELCRFGRS